MRAAWVEHNEYGGVGFVCSPARNSSEYETAQKIQEKQKLYHVGVRLTFLDNAAVINTSTSPTPPARFNATKANTPALFGCGRRRCKPSPCPCKPIPRRWGSTPIISTILVQSEFPTSTNVLTRRIEGRTDTHTGKTEALYRQMVRV